MENLKQYLTLKNLFLLAGAGLLALVAYAVMGGGSPTESGGKDGPRPRGDWTAAQRRAYFESVGGNNKEIPLFLRDSVGWTYEEIMDKARRGEINLVSELWALRRRCPKKMSPDQCNAHLLKFIKKKFPEPDNEKLAGLLKRYLDYENHVRGLPEMKTASPREKYEIMRRERREVFSDEEAKLIFGLQEAKYDFSENLKKFFQETKNLSGEERMRRYEQMKQETFGDYYDAVNDREPGYNKYETELALRQVDWKSPDAYDKNVRDLRERYFGEEGARRMEQLDKELAERDKKIADYEEAASQLKQKSPELKGDKLEAKLKSLRLKYMGKEAAEEYERRQQYEAWKAKNK